MTSTKMLACALFAAGCASGGSGGTDGGGVDAPPRVIASGGGEYVFLSSTSRASVRHFDADPRSVWEAAVEAYEELGIEITVREPGRTVGNRRFTVRRELAGERLSRYVRCGREATGQSSADTDLIHLSVVSRAVEDAGGGTRLETTVEATAQDVAGNSTEPVVCSSRGGLEERIADAVAERLAGIGLVDRRAGIG